MSKSIKKASITLFIVALALLPGSCGTSDVCHPGSNAVQVGGVCLSASFVPLEVGPGGDTRDIDVVQGICDPGPPPEFEPFGPANAHFTIKATPVSGDVLPEVYITKIFVEYIPRVSPDTANQPFTPIALIGYNAPTDVVIGGAGAVEVITEFETTLISVASKLAYYCQTTHDDVVDHCDAFDPFTGLCTSVVYVPGCNGDPSDDDFSRLDGIYSIRVRLLGSTEFGREFELPVDVDTFWSNFDNC